VWRRERLTDRHPGQHVQKQEPLAWGAPASGDVRGEFLRGLPSLLRPRAPSTGWASVVIRPRARASAFRSARRVERHICGSPLRAMAETRTRKACRRECKDGREITVHEVPAGVRSLNPRLTSCGSSLRATSPTRRGTHRAILPDPSTYGLHLTCSQRRTCLGVLACPAQIDSERAADPAVSGHFQRTSSAEAR
jgi:hypothetical protein